MTGFQRRMIDEVLEYLRHVRARPRMYLGSLDAATAVAWINGFQGGCWACGLELPLETREAATTARGWPWCATGPVDTMRESGLSEAGVAEELLAVESDAWELWRGGPR